MHGRNFYRMCDTVFSLHVCVLLHTCVFVVCVCVFAGCVCILCGLLRFCLLM